MRFLATCAMQSAQLTTFQMPPSFLSWRSSCQVPSPTVFALPLLLAWNISQSLVLSTTAFHRATSRTATQRVSLAVFGTPFPGSMASFAWTAAASSCHGAFATKLSVCYISLIVASQRLMPQLKIFIIGQPWKMTWRPRLTSARRVNPPGQAFQSTTLWLPRPTNLCNTSPSTFSRLVAATTYSWWTDSAATLWLPNCNLWHPKRLWNV